MIVGFQLENSKKRMMQGATENKRTLQFSLDGKKIWV